MTRRQKTNSPAVMSDPAVAPVGGGEIILYQPDEIIRLEVRLENNSVWLNRLQLAELFDRDVKTIGKHINNALREELCNMSVVANFATTECSYYFYLTDPEIAQIDYYPRFIHFFPLSNFLPLLFQSSNYSYWQE